MTTNENLDLLFNCVLHSFILFLIIGGFYFLYVSKLASKRFKSILQTQISSAIMPRLEKIGLSTPIVMSQENNTKMNNLLEYYSKNSSESVNQNRWLVKVYILILVFLFIIMMLTVLLFKFFCTDVQINIKKVLIENLVFFSLVGAVEMTFFFKVARNFIPSKPSELSSAVLNGLVKNFD